MGGIGSGRAFVANPAPDYKHRDINSYFGGSSDGATKNLSKKRSRSDSENKENVDDQRDDSEGEEAAAGEVPSKH